MMIDDVDTLIEPLLYTSLVIVGRCPKCECWFLGERLRFLRNQSCSLCGSALEIFEDGKIISKGYSPFTAEKYHINVPPNVPTPSEKTEGSSS